MSQNIAFCRLLSFNDRVFWQYCNMRLIRVKRLDPKRNETQEIYDWEENDLLLNPINIQAVRFEPNIKKTLVQLTNGREIIVDYTLKELEAAFEGATLEDS